MHIKTIGKNVSLVLAYLASVTILSFSAMAAGDFAPQLEVGGKNLVLNGEGPRKKAFLTIYDTALYLTTKSNDAAQIVQADAPMAMVLKMVSGLASAERMTKAMREGFEKATDGNTASIQSGIDDMMKAVVGTGVEPDDILSSVYLPGKGVTVSKNGQELVVIQGLAFKQALFGIWLSDNPVQGKLKKKLLGT